MENTVFISSEININKRKRNFAQLALNHSFEQLIPLLLIDKITEQELGQLRKQIISIITARANITSLIHDDNFESIRNTLQQMVEHNVGNVIELGDNKYITLTKALTAQLKIILQRSGFFNSIGLIQQFPNIRIKIGPYSAKHEHSDHPLSTSKLHCDIWAGAPKTLQICIIEILNINNGPKVEFGDIASFPRALARKLSGYDDPSAVQFLKEKVIRKVTSEEGFLHILDTYTPHRTIYPGDGIRVSIDFRIALKENLSWKDKFILKKAQFCDPNTW